MDDLVNNLLISNQNDMKEINILLKRLQKFKSKRLAADIQDIAIKEAMRLVNQNKLLEEYINANKMRESLK